MKDSKRKRKDEILSSDSIKKGIYKATKTSKRHLEKLVAIFYYVHEDSQILKPHINVINAFLTTNI